MKGIGGLEKEKVVESGRNLVYNHIYLLINYIGFDSIGCYCFSEENLFRYKWIHYVTEWKINS